MYSGGPAIAMGAGTMRSLEPERAAVTPACRRAERRPRSRGLGRLTSALRAAACVALALTSACAGPYTREPSAKHVILISIDTARADHFGFMGNGWIRTPNLDALAAESIVFDDYMTVVPTTLASHTTLFTGKYPHNHGTPRNGFTVNPDNEMLPEILLRAGMTTVGFAGSFALDSRFGFAQGFARYDEEFDILVGDWGVDQNQRLASNVTAAVRRYLDERGVPNRLFLFAHYFDPHRPYTAMAPYDTLYDSRGRRGLQPIPLLKSGTAFLPEEARREARRHELQYAAEISYTDEQIGLLIADLRDRGILDDALLVITTDHGESLWEHEEQFDHGFTVYQSTMHSVLMIRLPGGESGGRRVEETVASVDVLPTILEYLGMRPPADVDGEAVELRNIDRPMSERVRFGEATKPWRGLEDYGWANSLKARCVRKGRHKLIVTRYKRREELYDVVSDPSELHDLLADPSSAHEALARELRAELEDWAASGEPLPSVFDPSQREETRARLRSLGYLR